MKLIQEIKRSNIISNGHIFLDLRLHDEDYFRDMLRLERKRTERSARPFLLMSIDISGIGDECRKKIVKKIADQLSCTTRETDVKGWYSNESVIGILFTEPGERNETTNNTILRRIKTSLSAVLEQQYIDHIEFYESWFPDRDNGEGETRSVKLFYPEAVRKNSPGSMSYCIKRFIDVVGSLVGLAMFSPFLIVIPILIKISSEGPIFFRQERAGFLGKRFTFLKFRTMYEDCSARCHQEYVRNLINGDGDGAEGQRGIYKIKDDTRITRIGRFLRKASIDELPQFINVLKGDMSLVGPRPPIPYECDHYKLWHMRRVIEVKPGITGLWQVNGRSSCSFDEMVRLDLKYIREWSLWLDIKIIIKTPWVIILGKGAY